MTDEALKRVTVTISDAISSQGNMAAAMRAGAKALVGFAAEVVVGQMVRRIVSDMAPRFHSGGPVGAGAGLQPGELPAILSPGRTMTLPPGQIYRREGGRLGPLQHLGKTGPITVTVNLPTYPPKCGTCGLTISPHPMTGTTCACAPRQFAWSPLLCTCTGDGEQCEYCAAYFAGRA